MAELLDLNPIPVQWIQDYEGDPSIPALREPSVEEIETIFRSYRCEKLRWHADNVYTDEICPILLRTHYSNDEDKKKRHDEMIEEWIDVS
jgi:hypothetical protein